MGRILHPTIIKASDLELDWLQGQRLSDVSWSDPLPWLFSFSDGARLTVECPWRVIRDGTVAISSEDHGQQYGLPAPIDAAAEARERLCDGTVSAVTVTEATLDLTFCLSSGVVLQIIPFSRGYESWQLGSPGRRYIVASGGGRVSTYDE